MTPAPQPAATDPDARFAPALHVLEEAIASRASFRLQDSLRPGVLHFGGGDTLGGSETDGAEPGTQE